MPAMMPSTSAMAIQLKLTICGCSIVPMTASDMPPTPANTPRRAVFGSLIHCSERMNSAVETR